MELRINQGVKRYEVKDPDGELLGIVRFNPADFGMTARVDEAKKTLAELVESIPDDAAEEILGEIDRKVKAQFDYIFGSSVSEVFFSGVSSLAVCEDGSLVLENVMEAVAPIIAEAQKAAAQASNRRVEKHTAAYQGSNKGLAPWQTLPQTGK